MSMQIGVIKSKGLHWERCQYTKTVLAEMDAKGIKAPVGKIALMFQAIETHFMNAEPVGTCVAFIARMND